MPYDPLLAERIRKALAGRQALTEKKMFGGIGFMLGGNMAVGAHSDGQLMVRCSPEQWALWQGEAGAAAMVHGGRTPKGWLLVQADTVSTDEALHLWVTRGADYAASLG